jgi:hypothetical protein
MFRYSTYHYQGVWLVKFQNQQPVVYVVITVRIMCVTVAYKIELKYGYSNTRWFKYDRDKLTCLHTISPGRIWTTL